MFWIHASLGQNHQSHQKQKKERTFSQQNAEQDKFQNHRQFVVTFKLENDESVLRVAAYNKFSLEEFDMLFSMWFIAKQLVF